MPASKKKGKSKGEPLPQELLLELQQAFGRADLSGVRVHTINTAAAHAEAMGAQAFAVGEDVYFKPGAYHPHSEDTRRLLAHELAHVARNGKKSGR